MLIFKNYFHKLIVLLQLFTDALGKDHIGHYYQEENELNRTISEQRVTAARKTDGL